MTYTAYRPPVTLFAPNRLICEGCRIEFGERGKSIHQHPEYKNVALIPGLSKQIIEDGFFLKDLRNCSNAGKFYRFPIAEAV